MLEAAIGWGIGLGLVGCARGGPKVERLGGCGPRIDCVVGELKAVIDWAVQEGVSAGRVVFLKGKFVSSN